MRQLVEDARAAELDPVISRAVHAAVQADEGFGLAVAGKREGDEDGLRGGEAGVGFLVAGVRGEFEGDGGVAAGGGGCGVGDVGGGEERDQEG